MRSIARGCVRASRLRIFCCPSEIRYAVIAMPQLNRKVREVSRGEQSFDSHWSHVLSPQPSSLNLSRSSLSFRACDQTIGSVQSPVRSSGPTGQACFSATCGTVKPLDRSAFTGFGSVAIFGKWPDIVCCGAPNLFAILSWGMPRQFMRNILSSMPNWVAALRSVMYKSTVRLARPMAFPIFED